MSQIRDIMKVHNIIDNKLKHAPVALSVKDFLDMADLSGEAPQRIRQILNDKKNVSKVPHFNPLHKKEKWAYILTSKLPKRSESVETEEALPIPTAVSDVVDLDKRDIRVRINPDRSVTLITGKLRITIEGDI